MNVKKRNVLSLYPRFFLLRGLFVAFSWTIFAFLFFILGKKCADVDILEKICQIFGKDWKFIQYFVGGSLEEKCKLLNYALYFIIAIVGLNFISLLYNRYLWKKDGYIENNAFYLHNRLIFVVNTFIHVASACLLTLSFVSPLTVILALLFISFSDRKLFFSQEKKMKIPQTENFFSWKNQYVRKIILYSIIVIFVVPLVIGHIQSFHKSALEGSPGGLSKIYQEMINSSGAVKGFMELVIQSDYSLFHWFVLLWFVKGIINDSTKEFSDFWVKINSIGKRVTNYCHYYYYQENWAIANKTLVKLGDYSYLENSPNFLLSKGYLESELDVNKFYQQNQEVVKYIQFCEDKIKEPAEKNFLNWCLFNEFSSWKDCLRTKKLINVWIKKKNCLKT